MDLCVESWDGDSECMGWWVNDWKCVCVGRQVHGQRFQQVQELVGSQLQEHMCVWMCGRVCRLVVSWFEACA